MSSSQTKDMVTVEDCATDSSSDDDRLEDPARTVVKEARLRENWLNTMPDIKYPNDSVQMDDIDLVYETEVLVSTAGNTRDESAREVPLRCEEQFRNDPIIVVDEVCVEVNNVDSHLGADLYDVNVIGASLNDGADDEKISDDEDIGLLSYDEERKYRMASEGGFSWPEFDNTDPWHPKFEVGMKFPDKKTIRESIHNLAVVEGKNFYIPTNDKKRMYAYCEGELCQWKLVAVKVVGEESWQIKQFDDVHPDSCGIVIMCKSVKSKWIAKRFEEMFKNDPDRNVKGFKEDAYSMIHCKISMHQAYRAKRLALKNIYGDPNEQFAQLWDYGNELKSKNPGSTIVIRQCEEADELGRHRFDRMYVCFRGLAQGFIVGCRPIIGVDGTFLRGAFDSIFLIAISFDGNNQLFPIAYALVHVESKDTWEWFLSLLKQDLGIVRDEMFTFISDKQKGLLNAFKSVFPESTNRYCVRHLIGNLKKKGFVGTKYEDAIWNVAQSTTMEHYEKNYEILLKMHPSFPGWFAKRPPNMWSRAFQDEKPKCDTLLNNVCECFNSAIKEARAYPVVMLLEWVRKYIMEKLSYNRDWARRRWQGLKICPNIKTMIQKLIPLSTKCSSTKADDNIYEVKGSGINSYVVNITDRTCTCRSYQISGIPCKHAICALRTDGRDPTEYCDEYYFVSRYIRCYTTAKVLPIEGANNWVKQNKAVLLPPIKLKKRGRPSNKRRSDDPYEEEYKRLSKLPRQRGSIQCGKCKEYGHNRLTCKAITNIIVQGPPNRDGAPVKVIEPLVGPINVDGAPIELVDEVQTEFVNEVQTEHVNEVQTEFVNEEQTGNFPNGMEADPLIDVEFAPLFSYDQAVNTDVDFDPLFSSPPHGPVKPSSTQPIPDVESSRITKRTRRVSDVMALAPLVITATQKKGKAPPKRAPKPPPKKAAKPPPKKALNGPAKKPANGPRKKAANTAPDVPSTSNVQAALAQVRELHQILQEKKAKRLSEQAGYPTDLGQASGPVQLPEVPTFKVGQKTYVTKNNLKAACESLKAFKKPTQSK